MDADLLSIVAGSALSLGFAYIPGLRDRFEKLDGVYKRLFMGVLLLASAATIYGLGCAGFLEGLIPGVELTCDQEGLLLSVRVFFLALMANQSTYTIAKIKEE